MLAVFSDAIISSHTLLFFGNVFHTARKKLLLYGAVAIFFLKKINGSTNANFRVWSFELVRSLETGPKFRINRSIGHFPFPRYNKLKVQVSAISRIKDGTVWSSCTVPGMLLPATRNQPFLLLQICKINKPFLTFLPPFFTKCSTFLLLNSLRSVLFIHSKSCSNKYLNPEFLVILESFQNSLVSQWHLN